MSLGLFAYVGAVSADDSFGRSVWRERVVLAAGQVVQGDYVAAAPRVVISGTVNGDVYAAGGRILVDGIVNGDLIVAGAKVILSGKVAQDARIAAAHAVVSGTIGRNLTVGAPDIQLTDAGEALGNMLAAGGDVELEGRIGRDVKVAAREVTVSSHVGGNLALAAGSFSLTPDAVVEGKLRYWSDTEPVIDDGATVRGTVTHRPLFQGWQAEEFRYGLRGLHLLAAAVSVVSTLILGLVLLGLYPAFTRRASSMIRERPWRSLGWGAVALLGIPVIALAFIVTLLGLPVGLVLMALYGVMLYVGRVYAMTWLGQVLLRRTSDSLSLTWCFVTGLIVYTILSFLPVVGELVTLLTVVLGLGALLIAERDLVVSLRARQMV
jgi:cytoskeletal protein CcmA (bactofilin family)